MKKSQVLLITQYNQPDAICRYIPPIPDPALHRIRNLHRTGQPLKLGGYEEFRQSQN